VGRRATRFWYLGRPAATIFEKVAACWKMAHYKIIPQRFFMFRRKNLFLNSGVRGAAPADFSHPGHRQQQQPAASSQQPAAAAASSQQQRQQHF